jgi:penicillin-binding protein-related factor A (putative recombinase)
MGMKLELRLREVFRQLYDQQVAFVFKVPEALQQTPCDFFGFTVSGRAILIEAKQVTRDRLPLGTSNGLAPHQVTALQQASACGAFSIVVWQHEDMIMPLHWREVVSLSEGMKSIPLKRAQAHRTYSLLDWFAVALRS